jgi:hypothetical protein
MLCMLSCLSSFMLVSFILNSKAVSTYELDSVVELYRCLWKYKSVENLFMTNGKIATK